MQPFHVELLPGGVEVSRSSNGGTHANAPSPPSTSTPFFTAAVTLSITNRYDFTDDLWEGLTFGWQVELDGVVVAEGHDLMPSLPCPPSHDGNHQEQGVGLKQDGGGGGGVDAASAPAALTGGASGGSESGGGGGRATIARVTFETPSLPLPDVECRLTVTGRLRAAMPWAAAGHVVGHTQLELKLPSPEDEVRRQASLVKQVACSLFASGGFRRFQGLVLGCSVVGMGVNCFCRDHGEERIFASSACAIWFGCSLTY